jgi:hypothetical protein
MTVIISTIWGGRITQVVDRQISRSSPVVDVVDRSSTKMCVVLCTDALVSLCYTGVAVVQQRWMDKVIASQLAFFDLDDAMIQTGSRQLARPLHNVIGDLALNLNGLLNNDAICRHADLTISITGWHLKRRGRRSQTRKPTPLHWELKRGPIELNGNRYFQLRRSPVGSFFRANPSGLWCEIYGDSGTLVDRAMHDLENISGYSHDDVEQYMVQTIASRAREAATVSAECLAVQLDPYDASGQVQFTRYPDPESFDGDSPHVFNSGWLLTPGLICGPGNGGTYGSQFSQCGRYMLGGYSAPSANLHVRTRLPTVSALFGGPQVLHYGTQQRRKIP